MKIGLVIAMDKEFERICGLLTDRKEIETPVYKYISGKLGSHIIVAQQCGVGKVNAAVGTENMINSFSPDLVLSSGVAGGTRTDMEVMDIVACSSTTYHDVYCGEENRLGQIQGMPESFFPPRAVVETADKLKYEKTIHKGLIVTGDWFVTTKEKMREILDCFPMAMAVDMETCAIAQACHIRKVPFMSFRIISDIALKENQGEQYKDFWAKMADNSFEITKQFIELLPDRIK